MPLFLTIELLPEERAEILAMPFGVIWSIAVYNRTTVFVGPVLGYFLVIAEGYLYAALIAWGVALQRRLPGVFKLLAFPVLWAAFEFVKSIVPVVKDWVGWVALLAKSQWRFPPALQILGVTGFPGLTFLIMLANVALTFLLLKALRERRVDWPSVAALGFFITVVMWGAVMIPAPPADTFTIAATVDMANQDPAIQAHSLLPNGEYADTPEMSQAIFDVNAELTRAIADQGVAFVVWPENEFADADDERFINQLGALAQEIDAYIVADMVWRAPTGMHNTALMIGPDGNEVGRRAKISIHGDEKDFGFVPGPKEFPVFDTPYGKVGIAVCLDRHLPWITRELARAGAEIVLMPVDDDFDGNRWFPAFPAADAVLARFQDFI